MEPAIDLREQHFQRLARHLWLDFTERLTRANVPAYEIFSEIILPLIRASNTKELAEPAVQQLKPKMPSSEEVYAVASASISKFDLTYRERKIVDSIYEYVARHFGH